MTKKSFEHMTIQELIAAYEQIVLEQDQSFRFEKNTKFNKEFKIRVAIVEQLRSRPGDQRKALAPLLDRREPWMRICVAEDTYSLDPERSRKYMQTVADYRFDPYKGRAASSLGLWDMGYTPR
jgi:Domain of unknown function (DUF2019)